MKKDSNQLALADHGEGRQPPAAAGRPAFTTIDDLIQLSRDLFVRLRMLGEYKHPLAVRKGVSMMAERTEGKTIRAGSSTYFFDLKETREGKPYLVITESRFIGEDKERERSSLAVFPEHIAAFAAALAELRARLE